MLLGAGFQERYAALSQGSVRLSSWRRNATRASGGGFQGARGEVEYLGEFKVDPDDPKYETDAPETDGGPIRKVIVFRLMPVDTEPREPESPLAEVSQGPSIEAVPIEEQHTERAFVDPGREPYEAERREAKLVRALRDHLRTAGHKVVRYRILPEGELKPLLR